MADIFDRFKTHQPEKYLGTCNRQVLTQWIHTYDTYCNVHQVPEDCKIQAFATYLEGEATIWWNFFCQNHIQATAPNAAAPVINSVSSANGNRGTGSWYEQFANLNQTALPTDTSEPISDHLLSPRTMHWNLNVEQELPWDTTFQVGYVGERGEHLYGNTNLNPYVAYYELGTERVVPNRGMIVVRDNSDDSEYAGLWSELDHRFNHNFLFRASYTFGKAMDDGSEVFTTLNESSYQFSRYPTPRGTTDWGPSEYDHRQRLVLAYIWQPSVWHTEGAMKVVGNIVNNWAVAGVTQFQSGSTQNIESGFDADGDGISNDRPVLSNPKAPIDSYGFDDAWWYGASDGNVCSGPSFWYSSTLPCEILTPDQVHWIIPAYDQHPAHPIGRNSMYSPGLQQWDMNIQRSFRLHEKLMLDFRGELFNIFNHGNFGVENTTLTSGINQDAYGDYGTNTFASPYPTVTGHRHARIFIRISF